MLQAHQGQTWSTLSIGLRHFHYMEAGTCPWADLMPANYEGALCSWEPLLHFHVSRNAGSSEGSDGALVAGFEPCPMPCADFRSVETKMP